MKVDVFSVECKECSKQWRLEVPIGQTEIEAYGAICECGNILVGNIRISMTKEGLDENNFLNSRYLTNGSFQILGNDKTLASQLPLLEVES